MMISSSFLFLLTLLSRNRTVLPVRKSEPTVLVGGHLWLLHRRHERREGSMPAGRTASVQEAECCVHQSYYHQSRLIDHQQYGLRSQSLHVDGFLM